MSKYPEVSADELYKIHNFLVGCAMPAPNAKAEKQGGKLRLAPVTLVCRGGVAQREERMENPPPLLDVPPEEEDGLEPGPCEDLLAAAAGYRE